MYKTQNKQQFTEENPAWRTHDVARVHRIELAPQINNTGHNSACCDAICWARPSLLCSISLSTACLLPYSGNVILPVFFDQHYRCVPAQRHTPLCRSQLHPHGISNANGCRRHAHRTESNISLPHSSPINFPRNPSFINITPTPTPIITFYGPTQVPHYNTAWYGRGVVHITPQSHYHLLHKYRP